MKYLLKLFSWIFPKQRCDHKIMSYYDYNDGYTVYLCKKCSEQLHRAKI